MKRPAPELIDAICTEDGSLPCSEPNDCPVCVLLDGQRPGEARQAWLARIVGRCLQLGVRVSEKPPLLEDRVCRRGHAVSLAAGTGRPRTQMSGRVTLICIPCAKLRAAEMARLALPRRWAR